MEPIKHTTILNHFSKYLGIVLGICWIFIGCTHELDYDDSSEAESIHLSIKLPHPIAQNISTRAGASDFNTIKDINIIIADGDQIIANGYYFFQQGATSTKPEVNWRNTDGSVSIHFDSDLTHKDNLTQKQFYIVANYGKIERTNVPTVTKLRALTQKSSTTAGVPLNCVMFAKAGNAGVHHHTDGTAGLSLKAELKRTVAMVTVKIDGTDLNRNICLSNFSISLHNVPTECTIGQDNKPTLSQITPNGEFKEHQQLAWDPIVGIACQDNCGRDTWRNYPQITGKHYADPNLNPSDRTVAPLFQFENIHGKDFGAKDVTESNQGHKRPATVTSTDKNAIEKGSKNCSYVKVRAHYEKIDDEGNSLLSGWVSFKLFLGSNVTDNFDVKGNHYYQVTLKLTGNAVTEGGQLNAQGELQPNPEAVTWRVDTHLSSASFGTSDINLNAGGEFFYVDVVAGQDTEWNVTAKGDFFIWIYGKSNNTGSYETWQSAAEGTIITPSKDSNGRLLMYAQPGLVDDYYPQGKKYREIVLTLTPTKGGESSSITIRQYKRCEVTVTAAKYPYIKEVFGAEQLTLYVDRIDRTARPWGFYGEPLHVNKSDGFDNTYYLFEKNPTEGCGGHREFARRYLPFGTETRIDGQVLEDGGSAMIYAAMLYHNQDISQPSEMPQDIMDRDFPTIDRSQDYENKRWYWTIPSLEEWQILEKEQGQLDPEFPIKDWFQYWSSDAVTKKSLTGPGAATADSHSYAYQFGRGLDALKYGDTYPMDLRYERNTRLRFRLISVKPIYVPKGLQ